ncbi:MAG: hypothetical protein OXM55_08770 [Bdellovibrionales bacterium]|nr:hypothetical protein [Bdellovibrionales bacterium]
MKKKFQGNKKISIGLSGATGRMGKAVKELVYKKNSGFSLVEEAPPLSGFEQWNKKKVQGVVDFSSPVLFDLALKWCLFNNRPLVSGTTALSNKQKNNLKKAGKKIPVFYEENMSWGIWQIKQWIRTLSVPNYDLLLEDIHHKDKKDKPSGTALKLEKQFPAVARKKLKVISFRKGREFGTHRLIFKGPQEQVLLEHKALSRQLFAEGALKALKWLIKKSPGLYSFEDMYRA